MSRAPLAALVREDQHAAAVVDEIFQRVELLHRELLPRRAEDQHVRALEGLGRDRGRAGGGGGFQDARAETRTEAAEPLLVPARGGTGMERLALARAEHDRGGALAPGGDSAAARRVVKRRLRAVRAAHRLRESGRGTRGKAGRRRLSAPPRISRPFERERSGVPTRGRARARETLPGGERERAAPSPRRTWRPVRSTGAPGVASRARLRADASASVVVDRWRGRNAARETMGERESENDGLQTICPYLLAPGGAEALGIKGPTSRDTRGWPFSGAPWTRVGASLDCGVVHSRARASPRPSVVPRTARVSPTRLHARLAPTRVPAPTLALAVLPRSSIAAPLHRRRRHGTLRQRRSRSFRTRAARAKSSPPRRSFGRRRAVRFAAAAPAPSSLSRRSPSPR